MFVINANYGEFDQDYLTWMANVKLIDEPNCLVSLSESSTTLGEPTVCPEILRGDQGILRGQGAETPLHLEVCQLSRSSGLRCPTY